MRTARSKTIVLWLLVGFSMLTLSAPTLVVLGASFTAGNMIAFPPDGLSLKWYASVAGATDLRQAFLRSLYVATICTVVAIPPERWPPLPSRATGCDSSSRCRSTCCCRSPCR
jgi:putative spermidine/putrescine transport system permease protein